MTQYCSNSEPGTFNHECGKPATWIALLPSKFNPDGFTTYYCNDCKNHGYEAASAIRVARFSYPECAS